MKFLTKILKYWDIISGILLGLIIAATTKFNLDQIQLIYSIIILMLASIGCFRIIKQSIEKNKKIKRNNIIDTLVDSQKSIKAISLAQDPSKEGQKLGEAILNLLKVAEHIMKKIKELFDKFKGFILALALAVLSIVEICGCFINELLGNALVIDGINYNGAINTAAIKETIMLDGQKTRELITTNKIEALQDKVNKLELAQAVAGVVRYPTSSAYSAGANPFCACGCGCGNGNI